MSKANKQILAMALRVMMFAMSFMGVLRAEGSNVTFRAYALPAGDGVKVTCEAVLTNDEWRIVTTAVNEGKTEAKFKLVLAAEPDLVATHYLIPGFNYDGNKYGKNMPQGWEKNGEPWIFSGDRTSIPACTLSENAEEMFALYASDADADSITSACSLEKKDDGSFRHLIYWPVTEAPFAYTDKLKLTARMDNYLTLQPGERFVTQAIACRGKPRWPNFGFELVFRNAWKNLKHECPPVRSVKEVMRLDLAFQRWSRRKNADGYAFNGFLEDWAVFIGNGWKVPEVDTNVTIAAITADPTQNHWRYDDLEKSKKLKPGEYLDHPGQGIGFSAQTFQMARVSMEYGFRNGDEDYIDFGLKVIRTWLKVRQQPSGMFSHPSFPGWKQTNASEVGWAIGELSRIAILLEFRGRDGSEFRQAADKLVATILRSQRKDGNLGSRWQIETGDCIARGGDAGGYVLMGLARYWQLTKSETVKRAIREAFMYYFTHDIKKFQCTGGAMDCVSVDREGIHPFITAAVVMYEGTKDKWYVSLAERAGWYMLSWLYMQNPVYGPETDFHQYGFRPCGATIVGVQHPALDDYGCVLISDFVKLAKFTGDPLWREVAKLMWCNATQGFTDEQHLVWHGMERPLGAKNEAYFQTYWSKYRSLGHKRGHFNDLCTAWGGTYRLASIYDLPPEEFAWLVKACEPKEKQEK